MQQWATLQSRPRRDNGTFIPGARLHRRRRWMEDWRYVPGAVKQAHMVGRTFSIQPDITDGEIEALGESVGKKWLAGCNTERLSPSQRLDLIATEILRQDRLASGITAHSELKDYYSVGQWQQRSREIPHADIEAMVTKAMLDDQGFAREYGLWGAFETNFLPHFGATVFA